MKKLYPIITATSLVFIASLAGYHLPATGDRSPVKKIPVFIPDDTKVSLKNGTSLSGRLIKFDSQAKIEPPYILVGDSFVSYNVRLYAHLFPEKVVGFLYSTTSTANPK